MNYLDNFEWIAIKFGRDFDVAQRMNTNDFGNPLTFHLPPLAGQTVHSENQSSYLS